MPRVMIVDDDKTTVDLLKMLLELDGFEVVVSPTGNGTPARAHETLPDAFLVDFNLPDADGTEVVEKLRSDEVFRGRPSVMASGMERGKEALAAGANLFLSKPFEPDDLVAVLNKLLKQEGDHGTPVS